jgi:hypothetical protein
VRIAETHDLLTLIAALDNRRFGDETVIVWHEILDALPFADCRQAVIDHFAETTGYLMPAHVRAGALRVADQRRRAELRARIDQQQAALADGPAVPTTDRRAEVQALLAELRDRLPAVDEMKVRRPEVVQWDRVRNAEPNPHYDPAALVGLLELALPEESLSDKRQ